MKKQLEWMKRPFAHRGLHDLTKGIIENTTSSVNAAVEHGYGIEVDLQLASCGTPMVFHDASLDRLTVGKGAVADFNKHGLQQIAFKGTSDIMMSLSELLLIVDGKVPLLLEIKNRPEEVDKTAMAIIATVKDYHGEYAVMSFDPQVIKQFYHRAPLITRGLVSRRYDQMTDRQQLSWFTRQSLRYLLSAGRNHPDFIAYDIDALPAIGPMLARKLFGKTILTWTVRTDQQRSRAQKYTDAIIFEGFLP